MSDILKSLVDPAILAAALAFIAKILRDVWNRHIEVTAINNAFIAEIGRLIIIVKQHETWWKALIADGKTELHPLIPFSYPIYKRQVKNIGLLEPHLAAKAAKFYGYLEFLNSLQAVREKYIASQNAREFDKTYAESLKNFIETFKASSGAA